VRLLLGLALAGYLFVLAAPSQAQQAGDVVTIQGRVVNGTPDAVVPIGSTVRVILLVNEQVQGSWESAVQDDGSYLITEVPRIPDATYAVGLEYGDAAYVDRVDVSPGAVVASKDLTVFESVSVDPGIRFEQSAVVLSGVDAERGTLEATEVHSIINPTDVTFVPSPQGPGGPAGLLVFALPGGAAELTPLMGLDPSQVVQIDRGFASLMPIYPGRTDLSFRYRFPYSETTLGLERTLRYPVQSYRVLSSEPQLTLQSPQLAESTRADIGGRSFQAINGGPFDRGAAVAVTVSGLPQRSAPLGSIPPWTITACGALIGVAMVAYTWGRTRAAVPVPTADADDEAIVDRLLELERDRAAGHIGEESYRERRQALVASALAVTPRLERRANGGPE
jgi:hypothetical protein